MRLTVNLTLLLASLALVLLPVADALPAPRPAGGMITLPIRSLHGHDRKDLHPQLYLQQHLNRAERRLARMTGRAAPSDDELRSRLHKRMYIVGNSGLRKPLSKRFRRPTAMMEKFAQKAKLLKETGNLPSFAAGGAGRQAANKVAAGGAGRKAANKAAAGGAGRKAANKAAAGGAGAAADDAGATANGEDATANGADATADGADATANDADAADATADDADADATGAAADGADATAGTGQGVSPIDVQAAIDNTLTAANPPTADNSLGLDIEGPDTGYLAQVQLGTPPRNFEILMDSGSADFWVGAEDCKSEDGGGCGNHKFLGTQSSKTFVDSGNPFKVTYGTGEVSGTIITDNLNLAGLKLKAHTFGVAQLESVEFSADTTKFDGLMGLAQSGLSEQQTPTPIEALVAQGLIKDAITSYKISRLADELNDGEITFGGLDTTKFDQQTLVTLDNVNAQGFWEGAMDAITVDGQDTGLQGRTAILDTGTTLIVAPAADAAAVHNLITGAKSDGQGGFTIPCTTTQVVALSFGGQSFEIDPRDLAPLPVDPADLTGDCISGISSGNIGGAEEWLVGDVFLKNAYFSTDVQKNTVSLAKLV